MSARRDVKVARAFTATSTDEARHCRNEFEYVDRVALSTNRFYMIDSLDPGLRLSLLELERLIYRTQEVVAERGRRLGLREAAFVSFCGHCENHLRGPRVLRAIYLIKAMGKALSENRFDDYVDILDPDLAQAYEALAYARQLRRFQEDESQGITRPGITRELRKAILDYLGYGEEELDAKGDSSSGLIERREVSLLKARNSNGYSQFLAKIAIPAIGALVGLDQNELLSQFSFGILSVFEYLPPQIYFTKDVEVLKSKHLWHCPIPEARGLPPLIDDQLVVPTKAVDEAVKGGSAEESDTRVSQFILENYTNRSQDYSDGWAHQIALSQLWREALGSSCPCSYEKLRRVDCPFQRILYRQIRSYFMSDPKKQQRISTAYAHRLERKMKCQISPWTGKIVVMSRNRRTMKLLTSLPRQWPKSHGHAN